MNKRPFGFNFTLERYSYQVFVTTRAYGFKRIDKTVGGR